MNTATTTLRHSLSRTPQLLSLAEAGLLALTAICVVLMCGLTQQLVYLFLPWNLLLAYMPLVIQRNAPIGSSSARQLVLGLVWLLFLPNAPYIITDFIHPLQLSLSAEVDADVTILAFGAVASAALLGMRWFLRSLLHFEHQLQALQIARSARQLLLALVLVATGCGIWLGRVLRFNTWDVIAQPLSLVRDSLHFIATPQYTCLILLTTLLLWICWLSYRKIQRVSML